MAGGGVFPSPSGSGGCGFPLSPSSDVAAGASKGGHGDTPSLSSPLRRSQPCDVPRCEVGMGGGNGGVRPTPPALVGGWRCWVRTPPPHTAGEGPGGAPPPFPCSPVALPAGAALGGKVIYLFIPYIVYTRRGWGGGSLCSAGLRFGVQGQRGGGVFSTQSPRCVCVRGRGRLCNLLPGRGGLGERSSEWALHPRPPPPRASCGPTGVPSCPHTPPPPDPPKLRVGTPGGAGISKRTNTARGRDPPAPGGGERGGFWWGWCPLPAPPPAPGAVGAGADL